MKITTDHTMKASRMLAILVCILAGTCTVAVPHADSDLPDSAKVIQFLNQTIDWYRTVGMQQQVSRDRNVVTVGTDNRPMANQIVRLAFDFARVEADSILKASNPNANPSETADVSHDRALLELKASLDKQTQDDKSQLEALHPQLQTATGKKRQRLQSQMAEVQAELDLANARKDSLRSMIEFAAETSGGNARVGGLHAQIQALSETLPAEATAASNGTDAANSSKDQSQSSVAGADTTSPSGIWDLCADLFELTQEINKVNNATQKTAALANRSKELRAPLVTQLKALTGRGDDLARSAETASTVQLGQEREQLDALAVRKPREQSSRLNLKSR